MQTILPPGWHRIFQFSILDDKVASLTNASLTFAIGDSELV